MEKKYQVIQINENTWRIDEMGVRFFLLAGEEKALLIDSGMMIQNAKEIAEELTSLPVFLLNTHADPDHIGSNHEFEKPYMHPAELTNYHNTQKRQGDITPIWEGDLLELGNRVLEVITLPGHTPGSIAVLDQKNKMLFSGDPIQDGGIFMFGVQRDLLAYCYSLEKLEKRWDDFDTVYPSHGTCPVDKTMIPTLKNAARDVIEGKITSFAGEFHGILLKIYDVKVAKFLGNAD